MTEPGKKRILYLHTQPEHYFNLMIDDLNAASKDCFYQAAFLSKGHGWYKDLPVPKSCDPIFLRVRPGMEKYAQAGFRRAHIDWRKDIPPEKYDAVIVAGYAGVTQREVIKEYHRLDKTVMMMSDSNIRAERGRSFKTRLKRCVKKILLAKHIRNCDILLTMNSRGVAYWRYYGANKKKIVLCPFYADYKRILAGRTSNRAEVLGKFGIDPEKTVILTAARLVHAKGLDLMINAFKQLNLAEKGFVYALAGTGPLENDLKVLAGQENGRGIRFLGFVQPPDLALLINHSSLFVLPSRFEPHGIVIGEAMCAGVPVLVSDIVGAAKDLLEPGLSGWYCKHDSLESLLKSLEKWTNSMDSMHREKQSLPVIEVWARWFSRFNPINVISGLFDGKD